MDNAVDAAYAKAMKAFQEMMELEKKELKKAVLVHSEQGSSFFLFTCCCYILMSIDKRRRIEAEENAKIARVEGWFFFFFSFCIDAQKNSIW